MTLRYIEQGLKEIDQAEWQKDEYGCFNLYITHPDYPYGEKIRCCLSLRPTYCDRGHIQLNIEGPFVLDRADSFPRFFFSFDEADKHTRLFLKWRLWQHRVYEHKIK